MDVTEKQVKAFYNMQRALGWESEMPKTRSDMSKQISKMKAEIYKRLSITGYIKQL
jgi:hypothetical protein